MTTYGRLPVAFLRGEGPYLYDSDDQRYLDAVSGVAVCSLGHAHPAVARTLAAQASTLIHTSNLYRIPAQEALADRLCDLTGMDAAFFCNSGAESVEAAIKLARRHGNQQDIEVPQIVVMENSFHGRTMATLSASGSRKVQAGFEPLVQGFIRAPYNDLEFLRNLGRNRQDVVAVLVEPVQGEGGVNIPEPGYLSGIRELCDEYGWLMMLDEVQTGIGRTGQWFGFQHDGAQPDVISLAKALGNGMPIGCCLARGEAAGVLVPGTHGSTFGGNPLACSVAMTVLDTVADQGLVERAAQLGETMLAGFRKQLGELDIVRHIRGQGLLLGIELDRPAGVLVQRALEQHQLLINVTADKVVRLLPPLIITDAQAQTIVDQVSQLVQELPLGAS